MLDFKLRSLLKLNLKLFLDMTLLRSGGFFNVSSGQQFYDGSIMSLLLPDNSADDILFGVGDNQVWQSPFREWVYESGVPVDGTRIVNPPIVASGLLIEGAFRAPTDSTFGHTIDYVNGRVIFDNPQSSDLQVHAAFAYREVRIGFEHNFNQQFNTGYIESKYSTNPGTSMQLVYPSGFAQPFPAVFIEVDDRDFDAFELGNRSSIITDTVRFHIWALDDITRDNIFDIITAQIRKSLPIIDFNIAPLPLSGLYKTVSEEYVPYQLMLNNNQLVTSVGSGNPVRYIAYFDRVGGNNVQATEEYERAEVVYNVVVYLNAPTQTIGHKFSPIRQLGQIDTIF